MTSLIPFPSAAAGGAQAPQMRASAGGSAQRVDFLSTDTILSFQQEGPRTSTAPSFRGVVAENSGPPYPQGHWSNQELASLYRAQHMLSLTGLVIETDRGISDEGDPWFVFLDRSGEVFAHISRIDGTYLLDSLAQTRTFRAARLEELVAVFAREQSRPEAGNETVVPLAGRPGTVLRLHPGSLLAGMIWSIYLLSRDLLDTEASSGGDHPGLADPAPMPDIDAPDMTPASLDLDLQMGTDDHPGPLVKALPSRPGPVLTKEGAGPASVLSVVSLLPGSIMFGLSTLSISFAIDEWRTDLDSLVVVEAGSRLHLAMPVLEQIDTWLDEPHLHGSAETVLADEDSTPSHNEHGASLVVPNGIDVQSVLATVSDIRKMVPAAAPSDVFGVSYDLPPDPGQGEPDPAQTGEAEPAPASSLLHAVATAAQVSSLQQIKSLLSEPEQADDVDKAFLLQIAKALDANPETREMAQGLMEAADVDVDATSAPDDPKEPAVADFRAFNAAVHDFIDYLLEKGGATKIVSLSQEVVLIDMDAFTGGGDIYARSWTFDDGGVVSTIGLKSDFAAFDLIA